MTNRKAHTLNVLKSYGVATRGWWWRGAAVGFCGGVVVGLLLIALLAWLAENL